ncbi:MAG: peptidoglycan-binding domain-containing protein, partial [Thermodesulfobacteriota bacterium]|nr:peptidoglycan-binding domain-containing protein [Thermodesulfobacteriota bacterium]
TLGNTRMVNLIVERALYAAVAFGDNELSVRALKAAVQEIASCQVEVAERLGKKSRRKMTIAAAAAAFALLLFMVIPFFPSESGNRSLVGLVLSGSAGPEPEKKSVSAVVPEKTQKIVPKEQVNLVKSGKRENNSLTAASKKGEKRKSNITKAVSAPKPPKAYRDFLKPLGLSSLLPKLGGAVKSGDVAVFTGALPANLQMLKMERLPAQSKVKFSAFPWKHYARGGSAWIVLWKPPFIVKDFYYGYRSGDILTLQKMLKKLGYYWGPDDGMVGPLTWRAVNGFQKDMKLKRTMWPDPETVFWLFVMSGGSETLTTS